MIEPTVIAALKNAFPTLTASEFRGQTRVVAPPESVFDVLETLKHQHGFDMLADLTCVDYLLYRGATDRYGLVYVLTNTQSNERIVVRVFVNDPEPTVPSAVPLWEGANWLEREVWDLFGIRFAGHPDPRRVVLPEVFASHPLRKDYPLQGLGERHNIPPVRRGEEN